MSVLNKKRQQTNKTRLVRKVWSHNPDLFELIKLGEASKRYHVYLTNYHAENFTDATKNYVKVFNYEGRVKSFLEWLETEI